MVLLVHFEILGRSTKPLSLVCSERPVTALDLSRDTVSFLSVTCFSGHGGTTIEYTFPHMKQSTSRLAVELEIPHFGQVEAYISGLTLCVFQKSSCERDAIKNLLLGQTWIIRPHGFPSAACEFLHHLAGVKRYAWK
jgi:hypothetical protein